MSSPRRREICATLARSFARPEPASRRIVSSRARPSVRCSRISQNRNSASTQTQTPIQILRSEKASREQNESYRSQHRIATASETDPPRSVPDFLPPRGPGSTPRAPLRRRIASPLSAKRIEGILANGLQHGETWLGFQPGPRAGSGSYPPAMTTLQKDRYRDRDSYCRLLPPLPACSRRQKRKTAETASARLHSTDRDSNQWCCAVFVAVPADRARRRSAIAGGFADRSRMALGDSTLVRAAASSIASGNPSSRETDFLNRQQHFPE